MSFVKVSGCQLDKQGFQSPHSFAFYLFLFLSKSQSDGIVLSEVVSLLRMRYLEDPTDCDKVILSVIAELREAARCLVLIPGFSNEEILDFINFVCPF
jgi:hypothetical protein